MAEEKYTCSKCGKTFENKAEAGKSACPVCGSHDSKKAEEAPASSCMKNTRFS